MARSGSIGVRIVPVLWSRCGSAATRRRGAERRREPARAFAFESLEGRVVPSTISVLNTNNDGTGSLREAIDQANTMPGPDTIAFAPSVTGTITLSSALPDLSTNITVEGPGASVLTVARSATPGTPSFRIFTVTAGAEVTISGLTITGGRAVNGGGIDNSGTLTLTNSTLSGNSAPGDFGGGIDNSGTLTLTNSTLSGNSATVGGGISNSGTLTVTHSTLSGNSAFGEFGGSGGGIGNSGTLTVTHSTLSGNSATDGGGISNSGTLTVTHSTLSGNSAVFFSFHLEPFGGFGGGISNSGTLTVINSTLSGNSAIGIIGIFGFGSGGGGGISNSGTLTVTNSTLSGNSAPRGGGVFLRNPGGGQVAKVTAITSIFANPAGGNLVSEAGTMFISLGHNLFSDTPGVALNPADLINTDPRLGPLADNGGPTFTQALLPGSPAIDAGIAVPGVTTDQRGIPRPQGAAPDIGAFEFAVVPEVVSLQRFGFHFRPTSIVLTFSEPMDASRAETFGNYTLVALGHGPRRVIPLKAARYNGATQTVTLVPRQLLSLHRVYQLTVNGMAPLGLTSTSGVLLDGRGNGQFGTNFVAQIDRQVAVLPPVQHGQGAEGFRRGKPLLTAQQRTSLSALRAHALRLKGSCPGHPV